MTHEALYQTPGLATLSPVGQLSSAKAHGLQHGRSQGRGDTDTRRLLRATLARPGGPTRGATDGFATKKCYTGPNFGVSIIIATSRLLRDVH